MSNLKNWVLALSLILGTATMFSSCKKTPTDPTIDYSKAANWYKLPEIAKDVDAFYIYPTLYTGANEGDPDYAIFYNNIKDNVAKRIATYQASH